MTAPALAFNVRGKGRHYPSATVFPDLVAVPSVTNVIGVVDKPALLGWKSKHAALTGIVNARTIADEVTDLPLPDDPEELHALVKAAKDARRSGTVHDFERVAYWYDVLFRAGEGARDKAVDVGNVVHGIAEALTSDAPMPDYDDVHTPYAEAFLSHITSRNLKVLMTEATVYRHGTDALGTGGWAGTFDLLAEDVDTGDRILIDHKTGRGVYREACLQLAALNHADVLLNPDGTVTPWESAERCEVWHIRPDGCTAIPVRAGADDLDAFAALARAWAWVKGGRDRGWDAA